MIQLWHRMRHALAGIPSSHSSIVAAFGDGGSYSTTRWLWFAACGKVFECTRHSANRNSLSAVPGLWPYMARRPIHLLQEFHPISRTSRPVISIFSYTSVRSAPAFSGWQIGGDECHSGSNPRRQTCTTQGYKSWPHVMTNVSIPEVNMLKIAEDLLYLFQ